MSMVHKAQLKCDLAFADLIRDLAHAQEATEKLFAAIVRFVRHRQARGQTRDMMEQIRRDKKLCELLVDYEDKSEVIGMMEFVRDLKMKQPRRRRFSSTIRLTETTEMKGTEDDKKAKRARKVK
jgi:hypothetical protein